MKSAPMNYLATFVLGGMLWAVFAIFMAGTLTEGPSLATLAPEALASQLRAVFGSVALLSIISACYWYFYGDQPATATRLPEAKSKYTQLFLSLLITAISATAVLWYLDRAEGIEPKWFAIYFVVDIVLTAGLYWLATFLFSPRTVQYLPYGK